ncbi:Ig-like domain-containing protein [Variovorax sp. RHLX14]|uniref:Ig-like domain-containing protein n=1 Tax=Variovorax sp. RHLX14 TaxID=1259731 RepID=UPI003F46ADD8
MAPQVPLKQPDTRITGTNAFNATDLVNQSPATADVPAGHSTQANSKLAGKGRTWRKGDDLAGLADGAAWENAERMSASVEAGDSQAALYGDEAVTVAQADIYTGTTLAPQGGALAAPAAAGSFSPWMLGAIGLGAATVVAASTRDHGSDSNSASNSGNPSVASNSTIVTSDTTTTASTGTATATATVKAFNGTLSTAPVGASGNTQPAVDMPARPASESTATIPDASGTTSSLANVITATGPIAPPVAPPVAQISGLYDAVGITGQIVNGTVTDDARPTLSGHATAGMTVTVRDNDAVIGTVLASPTGSWSFAPTTPLAVGSHAFTVTVADGTGLSSAASAPIRFTVDTAPAFVTLDEVLDNVGSSTGRVGYGESTDDTSPQLKGTAKPGATVDLYDGHGIADKIGTVVADGTGHWTYTPTLDQGLHDIHAHVGGTAGIASSSAHQFTVATSPVVVTPMWVTLDGIFEYTSNGLQVGIISSVGDASPQLKGTATPGATVELYDTHGLADAAASKIGTVVADSTGHWTYAPVLQQGLHGVYAYVGGTAGAASSEVRDFIVTTPPLVVTPAFVTLDEVLDNVGSSTGPVGYGESTDDTSPQLNGTATPGSTVNLYDSHGIADKLADKIGTAIADGTGHWTYTPTLDQGLHDIYAHVEGAAGLANFSTHQFTVATPPVVVTPVFVTLDSVTDDVGSSTGSVAYGESTDDASPQIKGTASAGATVDLYDNHGIADSSADKIGTVIADGTGHWSYTPTLEQGLHDIYAYVDSTAGVAHTNAFEFYVDTSTLAARNTASSAVASLGKLDLGGNGDNTLKLSLDDLLNLGRTDLYAIDGRTQLMVNGDEGDAVELSGLNGSNGSNGSWTSGGTATLAGESYAVYQHSMAAAEVFIQHGVTAVLM